MTDSLNCCSPCGTPTNPVNIPGIEGPAGTAGTNGTNGQNAFTLTSGSVDQTSGAISISVQNASWNAVGQNIFISDGTNWGTFKITGISGNVITATWLNYTGDTGTTINVGAAVVAAGTQPIVGTTLLPTVSNYALGLSQALTSTYVQAGAGNLVLTKSQHYILFAYGRFDYNVYTSTNPHIVSMKLSYTTASSATGDVTNAIANFQVPIIVNPFGPTASQVTLCPVDYGATAGDTIYGNVQIDSTAGTTGTIQLIEFSLFALPVF